ncbi:hypothetical protein G5I_10754 [Acromyrmex echinatior]|uniref:Uncharacterized protein n=1 Tax=Acromyrmex echinatior TaxID=103372 RepID=F4WXR4_ACREC|nr:hypothetical protein G5I_10754 [Acromyrmex echinatior]
MKEGRKEERRKLNEEKRRKMRESRAEESKGVEEQRIPAGHDPANEPENANQSHDAALEIVHLRSNAAIPFPGLCCTCWWYGVTTTNTQPTNAPLGYDRERDHLYGITWYKDHEVFYKYVLRDKNPHVYDVNGVKVDVSKMPSHVLPL